MPSKARDIRSLLPNRLDLRLVSDRFHPACPGAVRQSSLARCCSSVVVGEWLGLLRKSLSACHGRLGWSSCLWALPGVSAMSFRPRFAGKSTSHTADDSGRNRCAGCGPMGYRRRGWCSLCGSATMPKTLPPNALAAPVKDLTAMAPQTARVEREGREVELSIAQVSVGETIIVAAWRENPCGWRGHRRTGDGGSGRYHGRIHAGRSWRLKTRRCTQPPSPASATCGCTPRMSVQIRRLGAWSRWSRRPKRTAPTCTHSGQVLGLLSAGRGGASPR